MCRCIGVGTGVHHKRAGCVGASVRAQQEGRSALATSQATWTPKPSEALESNTVAETQGRDGKCFEIPPRSLKLALLEALHIMAKAASVSSALASLLG